MQKLLCHVIFVFLLLTQETHCGIFSLEINRQHMIKIMLTQQCNLLIILTLELPAKAFFIIYFFRRICICFYQSILEHGRLKRRFDSWLDIDYFK